VRGIFDFIFFEGDVQESFSPTEPMFFGWDGCLLFPVWRKRSLLLGGTRLSTMGLPSCL